MNARVAIVLALMLPNLPDLAFQTFIGFLPFTLRTSQAVIVTTARHLENLAQDFDCKLGLTLPNHPVLLYLPGSEKIYTVFLEFRARAAGSRFPFANAAVRLSVARLRCVPIPGYWD